MPSNQQPILQVYPKRNFDSSLFEFQPLHEMDAGKDKDKALSIKMSPCPKQEKEVESKSQQKSMIFWGVILLAIFLGLVLIKQNSNDISLVKTYLKKNFINAKDNQGNTQLYYACDDEK